MEVNNMKKKITLRSNSFCEMVAKVIAALIVVNLVLFLIWILKRLLGNLFI